MKTIAMRSMRKTASLFDLSVFGKLILIYPFPLHLQSSHPYNIFSLDKTENFDKIKYFY